ncbi:prepilin-type N-terminal cleavage/methylation domain-containing protein [Aureimonas sp. AU12]|uniref:type IV pilus modification PilV family protein n=1 Tax=Aureimonas sp. AU12 TaxID=1638161 RepID=UPI00078034EE|nr:type II secretion system protein [Aureimonas sp. AU12]
MADPRVPDHLKRGRRSHAAGFTLIEALVAFLVLAIVMVVLQRGVVGSVDAAMRARQRIDAGLVAQTLLSSPTVAELGQATSGRMNGHDWTARFEDVPVAAGAVGQRGLFVFRPMRMIVDVRLSDGKDGVFTAEQIQSVRTMVAGP